MRGSLAVDKKIVTFSMILFEKTDVTKYCIHNLCIVNIYHLTADHNTQLKCRFRRRFDKRFESGSNFRSYLLQYVLLLPLLAQDPSCTLEIAVRLCTALMPSIVMHPDPNRLTGTRALVFVEPRGWS